MAKSSKYRGVTWAKCDQRWQARVKVNDSRVHIGNFLCEEQAAKSYDSFVKRNNLNKKLNFN